MRETAATQSALDEMVLGITARKEQKAVALTPVGTEKRGPLDGKQEAPFPFDDAQTVHQAILNGLRITAELQAHAKHIAEGLQTLAEAYGLTPDAAPQPVDTQKARERAADERHAAAEEKRQQDFAERYAEQQAAAQAATFKRAVVQADAPVDEGGWACPDHGRDGLVEMTSRKGRKYRACKVGQCIQFEK